MKKQKRIWIALFLALTLILILSGCNGNGLPKTAKINITFDPNPVPYDTEYEEGWLYNVILTESNGVGVTLTSIKFDAYGQQEQFLGTIIWDEEDIIERFKSSYLPAFSALSCWFYQSEAERKYDIYTVTGIDDNGNPIEATGRIDFLPQ